MGPIMGPPGSSGLMNPPHGGMAPMPGRMENNMYLGKQMGSMPQPTQIYTPQQQHVTSLKTRIISILKDRERFLKMEENGAKRILVESVRGLMEENGIASGA